MDLGKKLAIALNGTIKVGKVDCRQPSAKQMCEIAKPKISAPIVLYSYQDALDHVMSSHMMTNQNKKDKKLNYELELFEQNLEDLIASETGQITTATANTGLNSSTTIRR